MWHLLLLNDWRFLHVAIQLILVTLQLMLLLLLRLWLVYVGLLLLHLLNLLRLSFLRLALAWVGCLCSDLIHITCLNILPLLLFMAPQVSSYWKMAHQHLLFSELRLLFARKVDVIQLATCWCRWFQFDHFWWALILCSSCNRLSHLLSFALVLIPELFNRMTLVLLNRCHPLSNFLLCLHLLYEDNWLPGLLTNARYLQQLRFRNHPSPTLSSRKYTRFACGVDCFRRTSSFG